MAILSAKLATSSFHIPSHTHHRKPPSLVPNNFNSPNNYSCNGCSNIKLNKINCKATEISVAEGSSASSGGDGKLNWVPVVPLSALPKGERRVIIQDGETILLLWYKDDVFAIENRSPAEGAYSEGLLNAKLTQVFYIHFLYGFTSLLSCSSFILFSLLICHNLVTFFFPFLGYSSMWIDHIELLFLF